MGMASVSSLEDIIGGHIWIGFILLIGGAWHILVIPKTWATKLLRIGEILLCLGTKYMSKIGLFYGTQTGKTESIAEMIRDEFGASEIDMHDMSQVDVSDFDGYTKLIIASPTWDIGELQNDWDIFFPELDTIDFKGKTIAYFGTGDQLGYSDNFMDAIGILEAKISARGGKTIGYWSTEGYEHTESKADKNGKFVGLAIDEDNQPELTEERIKTWVAQIKREFT
jgi:flavodoxin I